MLKTGADEHVVCTLKWFLMKEENEVVASANLDCRATRAANMFAKIALNTVPRQEWIDGIVNTTSCTWTS